MKMTKWIGGILGITVGLFIGNEVGSGVLPTVVIAAVGGLAGHYLQGRILKGRSRG